MRLSKEQKSDSFAPQKEHGLLKAPLPLLNDPEGDCIPNPTTFVVDAHVHLFPDYLFASIRQWFENFGWPIRYQLSSAEIIKFLLSRGVDHLVALHYAHKPGIARELNAYMAGICRSHPQVTAMATIYPGEADAGPILEQAFHDGLKGVKLHSHVQCFDMGSAAMHEIYEICTLHHKPLIMHVGREPKSPAYPCDPYTLCRADKLERVLKDYPELKVCVPHLGADEFDAYQAMLDRYDNLWLDTTMTLAEYLPSAHGLFSEACGYEIRSDHLRNRFSQSALCLGPGDPAACPNGPGRQQIGKNSGAQCSGVLRHSNLMVP